jgi:hypothetical protein
MNSMIRSMPIEDREEMMMKMMPEMMKKADLKIMTPNMLKRLGEMVTLVNVYDFVYKIVKDEELKNNLAEIFKNLKDKMPAMMSMMMPMMKNFMPKMMSFMMPMMSEMMSLCKPDGGDMMKGHPEIKEKMAECMQDMCPNCVEYMYPSIPGEKRAPFALNMIHSISKQGSLDMAESEKEEFKKQALDKVCDGVLINN